MKKLKLNLQHFEGAEVLTRSQLKKVLGGDDGGGSGDGGSVACKSDDDCNDICCNCFCLTKIGKCGCVVT